MPALPKMQYEVAHQTGYQWQEMVLIGVNELDIAGIHAVRNAWVTP